MLNEFETQGIIAGDGPSWDCMFNCFIYTYKQLTGETLNHDALVNLYKDLTKADPEKDGGTMRDTFFDFISKFDYCASKTPTNSTSVVPWASFDLDGSGILHWAIPTAEWKTINGIKKVKCIDPTTGFFEWYPVEAWKGTYNVGLCGVESTGYIDSSMSTGSTGSYGSVNPASTGVDYYYA